MLRDFPGADHVFIACRYTVLRKGIDGLVALAEKRFRLEPCSNSLFLFCGHRRDRTITLYSEGDGFERFLLLTRLQKTRRASCSA